MLDRLQHRERPPLRIAHLVSHSAQNGVATSVKTLIDEQIKAGHQLMLVHPHNSWIGAQEFAGPVAKRTSTFRTRNADLRATGYPIREWGRTVVHSHGSVANKFLMVFRLADGVPSVMTAHARYVQIPWRFAHAVVAPSRQTAAFYLRGRIVSPRRLHVVPHIFDAGGVSGVDCDSRAAARSLLGLRPDRFVLGSVGTICERKNQIDMVRVLDRCVSWGMDAELLLVGADSERPHAPEWEALLSKPSLAGRVHLAGHRADALGLMHAMDLFLCTSRVEEGPIALFEAMATGLPVLSTDVGFASEIIESGLNGEVFRHGDVDGMAESVRLLATHPMRRAEMAARGRRAVMEHLSSASLLPRIEDVYWQALSVARDRGKAYFKNSAHRIDLAR